MLLLLGLPLFLLSFVKVTVDAQEMRENAITVNYSSAVDEQGGLVIGDARGEVVVDEENTFYGIQTHYKYHQQMRVMLFHFIWKKDLCCRLVPIIRLGL